MHALLYGYSREGIVEKKGESHDDKFFLGIKVNGSSW